MDRISITINIAALTISMIALVTSMVTALRQARLMRHANSVPVAIDMLSKEYRSAEFLRQQDYVVTQFAAEHSAELGLSQLPEPFKTEVYQVAYYYQTLAYLVAFDLVDEDLVLSTLGYRIRQVWQTLEPYIKREREIRKSSFLTFLEDLACRSHMRPASIITNELQLQQMPDIQKLT